MWNVAKDKLGTTAILLSLFALFWAIPEWQVAMVILMWITVVSFCLLRIRERILLLLFQMTLFTFLMTRLVLPIFFSTEYIDSNKDGIIQIFDAETLRFIYTTLSISVVGTFAGFAMIPQNDDPISLYDTSTTYVELIRRISKFLSYVCSAFYLILIGEKALFVFQNGYFAMYAEFNSQLPAIIHKLSSIYIPLFFLFLATFPSKQDSKYPIILYLCINTLSLATGSRAAFMIALVFLLFYFSIRNIISPEDPWLSRKAIIMGGLSIPFLLVGMFMIDFIRGEKEMENAGIADLFINFFYQQGTSVRVIGYTFQMQDILNDGRIFSFGQIIDNFKKNIIFQLMGTAVEYRPQTAEMALYGHSLANTLTYYTMYKSFIGGAGLGSSYIAEVWHDFGYIGLVLWNLMYGIIFAKFYQWIKKGIWVCVFSLIMIPEILYSPRSYASAFLNVFFSISILLTFLIVHILAKRFSKQ